MSIKRAIAIAIAGGLIAFLLVMVAIAVDLHAFEWPMLLNMLGWRGLTIIILVIVAMIMAAGAAVHVACNRRAPAPVLTGILILCSAVMVLWALDWMFLETPLSIRRAVHENRFVAATLPPDAEQDFQSFSLARRVVDGEALERLRVMYARALINNPDAYANHAIGATIDRRSAQYGVDPTFLFFRLYLISYYGEATSGPVPFLRNLTSEGIRDLVQIHLPGWFVESRLRSTLISSQFLPSIFGEALGNKLRYAIHKATLDVSAQPYDLSTYSDVYAVLMEFPDQFPDIFVARNGSPLQIALRDSFLALKGTALAATCEAPYLTRPYDARYYDEQRAHLKQFARAAYYLTLSDFDFATRVQALLSTHHARIYRERLTDEVWNSMPDWQRSVMLAMPRDLFKPNIGRLAYNLYAIPELNCTPVEYIAASAALERKNLTTSMQSVWLPPNEEYLWAASGYQLTVLNEVWSLVNASPIPGLTRNDTVNYASQIVSLNATRLENRDASNSHDHRN
jgi:hypothetical protein